MMASNASVTAQIVPSSAAISTKPPWYQGVVRALAPFLAALPAVVIVLAQAIKDGTIPASHEIAIGAAAVVIVAAAYNKARTEQQRQSEQATLSARGLPVGQEIAPGELHRALYTPETISTVDVGPKL